MRPGGAGGAPIPEPASAMADHRRSRKESYHSDSVFRVSTRPRPGRTRSPRPRVSHAPALGRLADRMLEAATLDALARLLTADLPEALGIGSAALLLWNRKLDSFEGLTPGETNLASLRPEGPAVTVPEAGCLLSEGTLLPTRGGNGEGVLVPLMARSGVVGMLVLGARTRRRKVPFRP